VNLFQTQSHGTIHYAAAVATCTNVKTAVNNGAPRVHGCNPTVPAGLYRCELGLGPPLAGEVPLCCFSPASWSLVWRRQVAEGQAPSEQSEEQYASAPDVDLSPVVQSRLISQVHRGCKLRWHIAQAPAEGHPIWRLGRRKPSAALHAHRTITSASDRTPTPRPTSFQKGRRTKSTIWRLHNAATLAPCRPCSLSWPAVRWPGGRRISTLEVLMSRWTMLLRCR
jgi:hypothetical protein